MNEFRIKFSTAAKRDLFEIKKFIQKDSPAAAARVLDTIVSDISILEFSPEAGPKAEDPRLKQKGYRYLVIFDGKYILFYVVSSKKQLVQIRRILSTRQNYLKILKNQL